MVVCKDYLLSVFSGATTGGHLGTAIVHVAFTEYHVILPLKITTRRQRTIRSLVNNYCSTYLITMNV